MPLAAKSELDLEGAGETGLRGVPWTEAPNAESIVAVALVSDRVGDGSLGNPVTQAAGRGLPGSPQGTRCQGVRMPRAKNKRGGFVPLRQCACICKSWTPDLNGLSRALRHRRWQQEGCSDNSQPGTPMAEKGRQGTQST